MGDEGGSIDYKREQRLAALEEKRRKLAEAKAKNAQARPVGIATPPSTPVKQLEGAGSSWNDIVATIEAMPVSATSTPMKQSEPTHTAIVATKQEKQPKPLVMSIGVSQIDIPPKREVQMYSRGTQTTATASQESLSVQELPDTTYKQEGSHSKLVTRSASSEIVEVLNMDIEPMKEVEEAAEEVIPKATLMSEAESKSTVESNEFLRFMSQTAAIMDRALLLSERYDLLEGKYDEMDVAPRLQMKSESKDIAQILTLFDKEYSAEQQLNDIDWNPFEKGKVITATYDRDGGSGSSILEYNLDYDGRLENRMVYAASRVTTAKYWTSTDSTYNTSAGGGRLIIGGSYTGQVVLWDVRTAGNRGPIISVSNSSTSSGASGSNASASGGVSPHKHPIYSLQIIDNRHFASVDMLGTLAIWDIYKMSHPVEELALTWVKTGFLSDSSAPKDPSKSDVINSTSTTTSPSNEVSVTGISFRDENTFFIASEDGSLFSGQRHGDRKGLLQHFRGHQATLSSVRAHPSQTSLPSRFGATASSSGSAVGAPNITSMPSAQSASSTNSLFKYTINDLILTSSVDWSVNLWHPKLSTRPLATFSDFSDYVMDVAWSNHHPAIFAAVDSSGLLSVWNLNSEEREVAALTNNQAAPHALHKVLWSPHQPDVLVAASHTSYVHVYKVDSEIVTPSPDEWSRLEATIADYHEQLVMAEREEAAVGIDTF